MGHIGCVHIPSSTQGTRPQTWSPPSGNSKVEPAHLGMQIPHLIPNHFRGLLSGKLRLREVSGQAGAQTRALRVFMTPACFSECKETSLPTLETSGSGDSGCSAASCEDVPGRCCQLDFQSAWGGGLGLPPRPQTGLVTTGPRGSSRERSLGPDRGARGTGALGGRCCVPRQRQGNELIFSRHRQKTGSLILSCLF